MPQDRFPPDPAGARAARRFARQSLWDHGPVGEIAELLVSEIASNVVRHASAPFVVDVLPGDPIRVELSDGAGIDLRSADDVNDAADDDDEDGGRGLLILDALAERWGIEPTASGNMVWFELRPDQSMY